MDLYLILLRPIFFYCYCASLARQLAGPITSFKDPVGTAEYISLPIENPEAISDNTHVYEG